MSHMLGGFLVCQYPKDLRYKISMNSMISMVVFECLNKNCGSSSFKKPNKPSLFMILECKFIDKGYVE
jgi:hypothetical protein